MKKLITQVVERFQCPYDIIVVKLTNFSLPCNKSIISVTVRLSEKSHIEQVIHYVEKAQDNLR